MDADSEYTVVVLPQGGNAEKRALEQTELINRVAAHGWRLAAVASGAGPMMLAYFERRTASDG